MVFLVYEQYKERYIDTQKRLNEILLEKEELFTKTQPKAITYDKERVSGGGGRNAFDDYLLEKEKKRIDERIAEVKSLLDDRRQLIELKELELRSSKNMQDKIYTMRYLDNYRINRIASSLGYSESQVYRILQKISCRLKK